MTQRNEVRKCYSKNSTNKLDTVLSQTFIKNSLSCEVQKSEAQKNYIHWYHTNINQKKAEVAIYKHQPDAFRINIITRLREGYSVIIK